jgi:hypothetical protein
MVVNTKFSIGDEFLIESRWFATLTTIEISGNESAVTAVYKLEWISDGCLKSEWFTEDRMRLLGIKKKAT